MAFNPSEMTLFKHVVKGSGFGLPAVARPSEARMLPAAAASKDKLGAVAIEEAFPLDVTSLRALDGPRILESIEVGPLVPRTVRSVKLVQGKPVATVNTVNERAVTWQPYAGGPRVKLSVYVPYIGLFGKRGVSEARGQDGTPFFSLSAHLGPVAGDRDAAFSDAEMAAAAEAAEPRNRERTLIMMMTFNALLALDRRVVQLLLAATGLTLEQALQLKVLDPGHGGRMLVSKPAKETSSSGEKVPPTLNFKVRKVRAGGAPRDSEPTCWNFAVQEVDTLAYPALPALSEADALCMTPFGVVAGCLENHCGVVFDVDVSTMGATHFGRLALRLAYVLDPQPKKRVVYRVNVKKPAFLTTTAEEADEDGASEADKGVAGTKRARGMGEPEPVDSYDDIDALIAADADRLEAAAMAGAARGF